jgi:hypothetical protein
MTKITTVSTPAAASEIDKPTFIQVVDQHIGGIDQPPLVMTLMMSNDWKAPKIPVTTTNSSIGARLGMVIYHKRRLPAPSMAAASYKVWSMPWNRQSKSPRHSLVFPDHGDDRSRPPAVKRVGIKRWAFDVEDPQKLGQHAVAIIEDVIKHQRRWPLLTVMWAKTLPRVSIPRPRSGNDNNSASPKGT